MSSALRRLVQQIKAEDKAQGSISEWLKKTIDDYCSSDKFDKYLALHRSDMVRYIEDDQHKSERKGMFRASSAGKCLQKQAFDILDRLYPTITAIGEIPLTKNVVRRPSRQYRALYNGTFAHIRWHMLFDALHAEGIIETLYAEELRYYDLIRLSGTPDRVLRFTFNGNTVVAIIDYKTIKHEYFIALREPQEDHVIQQHSYGLFGFNADCWIMLYEDKNDHELKIYDRPYDFDQTQLLHMNCRNAMVWIEDVIQRRTPTVELTTETSWCNYCEWNSVCKKLHPDREDLKRYA